VPEFRSRFLQLYHQRYARPLRDYLIAALETTIPAIARIPGLPALYNALMQNRMVRRILQQKIGMVDSPLLSRYDFRALCAKWQIRMAQPAQLEKLTPAQCQRSVIFVSDCFTRYFDAEVFATLVELAVRLKYEVLIAPFSANGKPLHVQGFLSAFDHTAIRTARRLNALAQFKIPLVGLDPAMTLVYRQEYRKVHGIAHLPEVLLPQEWLLGRLPELPKFGAAQKRTYHLLQHCTEKTNAPGSGRQWMQVFAHFGLTLELPASGCCGMSGTYGHEARNADISRRIYAQSWQGKIEAHDHTQHGQWLATGYSCRSQVKRMSNLNVFHPLHALLERVQ